jgi:hypothetical protein
VFLRGRRVLVRLFAVLVSRGRVRLGLFMLARLVVMSGLMMMVGGGVMMRGGVVMMLARWMFL